MVSKRRSSSVSGAFQLGFDDLFDPSRNVGGENVTDAFRRLYFHLYTNSEASRAERIVSDLSLLLLLKLAVEVHSGTDLLARFTAGRCKANSSLVPFLQECYPGLVDSRDRFAMSDEPLREALQILEGVSLSESPAHVLGDAFQALIGPRLRGEKGQFFTPRSLVRAMVRVADPRPGETVLDPACGTGGFLFESHSHASRAGSAGAIVGIDKDHDLFRIASALLEITCGSSSHVYNTNSLLSESWKAIQLDDELFDVVLTNPPFGTRIAVKERRVLARYVLARQWAQRPDREEWRATDAMASSQDPQVLFLELCVSKLRPGGRMGIVLPEGLFGNRRTAFIWDWLRSEGRITGLIDCPRTTFQPGTDTKTNVLFFEKSGTGKSSTARERVNIAVALNCGHDRRGRTHHGDGRRYADDFAKIDAISDRSDEWRTVEITRRDYLVPRYYSKLSVTADEQTLVSGAKIVRLGDLQERRVLTLRKGHEVGSHAYGTGDVPFVRTSDVNNFEISADPTKSVSEDVYARYERQQRLRAGDILMVVDGRYRIGTTALLTEANYRCVVQSHFRIITIDDNEALTPSELLFALNLPSVKLRIRDLVFIQSTLGTIGNRLLELEVPVLHGDGPWRERVSAFERLLALRDDSLEQLRRMTAPEFEL